jgi:ATP-dependent protease HslVU (ClpYQ) peptidase subunit
MTCIVGLVSGDHVIIGGDSCGSSDDTAINMARPKVFRVGQYLIGFTDSFRVGQVLEFNFKPPVLKREKDVLRFMVSKFVPAVKACFREGGTLSTEDGQESGNCFMVGVRNRLFVIEENFQILEAMEPYISIGSGANFALGCLYYCKTINKLDKDAVEAALNAAAHNSTVVRPPFTIISTED